MRRRTAASLSTGALLLATLGAVGATAPASAGEEDRRADRARLSADIDNLNNSGAMGDGYARVNGLRLKDVVVGAHGLAPDLPHAMHIHYSEEALNMCPTTAQDANGDFRLTTLEGVPAYGEIVVSLTETGPTDAGSGLDVERFSTAPGGVLDYRRKDITFTDTAAQNAADIAKAVRDGEGVVVIHGVDYNGNGVYDFDSAGPSDLDPTLPAEATDPAACGVLADPRDRHDDDHDDDDHDDDHGKHSD